MSPRLNQIFTLVLLFTVLSSLLLADQTGLNSSGSQKPTPDPTPAETPTPVGESLIPTAVTVLETPSSGFRSVINDPVLRQKRDMFAGYMNSAMMMPINLFSFLTPDEGVSDLKGISLCVKRFSMSDFDTQLVPETSLVYGVGILDNVIVMDGIADSLAETGYSIDFLSVNAAAVMPVEDYAFYGALGARFALSHQPLLHPSFDYGKAEFLYVSSFNTDNSGNRSYSQGPVLGYSTDIYAKAGLRVYKSWYLSGSLGLRYVPSVSGKWYTKSDVDAWENGELPFEPDEWIIAGFPTTNQLLSGSTLYLNFTISPYF